MVQVKFKRVRRAPEKIQYVELTEDLHIKLSTVATIENMNGLIRHERIVPCNNGVVFAAITEMINGFMVRSFRIADDNAPKREFKDAKIGEIVLQTEFHGVIITSREEFEKIYEEI